MVFGRNGVETMMATSKLAGNAAEILTESGTTILILLVVVFLALIVLTFVFWLFGKAFGHNSAKKQMNPSELASIAPTVTTVSNVTATAKTPVVQEGIPEEVVAAIAAAVACMAPEGKKYVLRNVSRAPQGRPVWATAGLIENTRPF